MIPKPAGIALVIGLIFVSGACRADIHSFNEAVKHGDYRKAATETDAIWRNFDKTSPQTATVAREFGFINYLAGNYEAAYRFAKYLVDDGKRLQTPDDQPATSAVLLRAADYRLRPGWRTRGRLMDALKARRKVPGVDNITVLAAQLAYTADWQSSSWIHARHSAALAADLLSRAGRPLLAERRRARMTAVAAAFMETKKRASYNDMTQLYNGLSSDIEHSSGAPDLAQLRQLGWQALAWVSAMQAYFESYYVQTGSHVNLDIDPSALSEPPVQARVAASETRAKPRCPGYLYHPPLHIPYEKAFRGMVGAVVLRGDFNDKGYFEHPEVLASAPTGTFNRRVLDASPTFRWQAKQGVDTTQCTLSVDPAIVTALFIFD